MPAHPQVADVVEEDDSGRAVLVLGLTQQCAHEGIRASRFVDNCRPEFVVLVAEAFKPDAQWTRPEIGGAADHDAGWLTAGMGIDYLDLIHLVRRVLPR